ncbi:unnamed protein product [Linum trigynum]|uniref:Erythronate-4-phosphate dehydrogenase family protein n=1 Tax=Linum trigynum TaxID=586398 RepID=A0AAV2CJ61_9ROSI
MDGPYDTSDLDERRANSSLQIIKYSPFQPSRYSSPWLELRVFYVRISNFHVDDTTPEFLTINHIPLSPDTLLEVNGVRSSIYSDGAPLLLRRDRVDKKSEEVTFVSTDSIRTTGSVKFDVFDKDDLVLSGTMEMSNSNGFTGECKGSVKRWSMKCESEGTTSFLRGKHVNGSSDTSLPAIEVYVTGCFSGTPIILTKTLQLSFRKKHNRKGKLDSIPEDEATDPQKVESAHDDELLLAEYRSYKLENGEEDYSNMYWRRTEFVDGEDGELSWFNAGVRVGVGIGLGICVGVGIGVGLMVRTYQTTTRNFKRRLL